MQTLTIQYRIQSQTSHTKNEHKKINETKYACANGEPQSVTFFVELGSQSACKHDNIMLFQASPVAQLFRKNHNN